MRARGFTTAPALVGVNVAVVPELPSPASFNHVITTVDLSGVGKSPNLIWLDTTPEVAPFRVLIPQIRDEQALVILPAARLPSRAFRRIRPIPIASFFRQTQHWIRKAC